MKQSSVLLRLATVAIVIAVSMAGLPARAEVVPGGYALEIYGGLYEPAPDGIDSGATYGVRFGFNISERFNIQGTVGYAKLDLESGDGEIEAIPFDLTFAYYLRPDKRVSFKFGGGTGWADVDLDGALGGYEDVTRSSLSFHAVVGAQIELGNVVFLYPEWRPRLYTRRDSSKTDHELTLSLGFRWGGDY